MSFIFAELYLLCQPRTNQLHVNSAACQELYLIRWIFAKF